MTQYGFYFNAARCTGCKTCALACKDYWDLPETNAYRQVFEFGGGSWVQDGKGAWSTTAFAYYISLACNHCGNPICVQVCPTGAMHKDDNGLVSVDRRRCIGCGYCELSCPYRAPKVDRKLGCSTKCDGCADRVSAGEQPICVKACQLRALQFGPIDKLQQEFGTVADVAPLPPSSATAPNLVITLPHCIEGREGYEREGCVLNPMDII